jgi:hypothetical protein
MFNFLKSLFGYNNVQQKNSIEDEINENWEEIREKLNKEHEEQMRLVACGDAIMIPHSDQHDEIIFYTFQFTEQYRNRQKLDAMMWGA